MGRMELRKQDLIELYQLCRMYRDTYGEAEGETAEKIMADLAERYRERTGGNDIAEAGNPREAGRKKVYGEKINNEIRELHRQGISKRKIAKKIGCSLGHVQDVTREPHKWAGV